MVQVAAKRDSTCLYIPGMPLACWIHAPEHATPPALPPCPQADPAVAFEQFARLHRKPYLGDSEEYARRHEAFKVRWPPFRHHALLADTRTSCLRVATALACASRCLHSPSLSLPCVCAALQANLAKIAAHNALPGQSFQLGLNAHADLTAEEFRLRYFGPK